MTVRIPIYVDASIPIQSLQEAIAPLGYHLRIDAGHRFVIDPIPKALLKQASSENVVALPRRKKR